MGTVRSPYHLLNCSAPSSRLEVFFEGFSWYALVTDFLFFCKFLIYPVYILFRKQFLVIHFRVSVDADRSYRIT